MTPSPIPPTRPYQAEDAPLLTGFRYHRPGTEEKPWEADVREWITGGGEEGGVQDSIELLGTTVWVYLNDKGEVIGFTSLATLDSPVDGVRVQGLPFLGLDTKGRGGGLGLGMFEWTIQEARRRHIEEGLPGTLLLYVDPNNDAASKYERRGFQRVWIDESHPRKWVAMTLRLTS